MRHLLAIFLTFTLLLFYPALPAGRSSTLTSAQTFDFNRAYQDYLYNFNLYRNSYQNYLSAKNEYQRYKTLTSETRAFEATKTMLQNRSEALRTYLTTLRMKLQEITNIVNYEQNQEYLKLDTETTWLSSHKKSLAEANSLADLLVTSSQLERRYPDIELLSYQTFGNILVGKQNTLRNKISFQIQKTDDKVAEMALQNEDVILLKNWLGETKKKITLSEEKQKEGETIIKRLRASDQSKKREFEKAQASLEQSNQHLKEATRYLLEIVREIKNE